MSEAVSPDIDAGARRRLQLAALELFNRKGYASTSVREIVELAGVTKPVLYYHFGSKEGIYLALLEDALAVLRETMQSACESGGSARQRIAHVSQELYRVSMENSEVVRKALGEHVFNAFIANKKIEWDQYRTQVTEYELNRYLPIL